MPGSDVALGFIQVEKSPKNVPEKLSTSVLENFIFNFSANCQDSKNLTLFEFKIMQSDRTSYGEH